MLQLPGQPWDAFGVEIKLSHTHYISPDIAFAFYKEQIDKLIVWCNGVIKNNNIQTSFWNTVLEIAENMKEGGVLYGKVVSIWLELDKREFYGNGSKDPAIFLELKDNRSSQEYLAETLLPIITGKEPDAETRSCLKLCTDNLPPEAGVTHVGYFPARSKNYFRLTAAFPKKIDIKEYCTGIFRKKIPLNMFEAWRKISSMCDLTVVHLDIGRTLLEKLGCEYRFKQNEQDIEYQSRWVKFLEYIKIKDICSVELIDELLAFPAVLRYVNDKTLAPIWYKRYLYYIKGVYDFNGGEQYKAYCAFDPMS